MNVPNGNQNVHVHKKTTNAKQIHHYEFTDENKFYLINNVVPATQILQNSQHRHNLLSHIPA